MLAIGRALMREPDLLLLDEPSLGLAPNAAGELLGTIRAIQKASEIGVLMVEQKVREVLSFSERTYCLKEGKIVDGGPSREFAEDLDRVKTLFF